MPVREVELVKGYVCYNGLIEATSKAVEHIKVRTVLRDSRGTSASCIHSGSGRGRADGTADICSRERAYGVVALSLVYESEDR